MGVYIIHGSILAQSLAVPGMGGAQTQPVANPPKAATNGKEIVVTGTRAETIAKPDRLSFSIANDLQVQTGTLADALRAVPGVEVDVEGRVSLRGDAGVTILIDGRPSAMLKGENRGDVLMSMPATQIDRVEVITNPSAAMSPEGSGGVINLVTKQVGKDMRTATIKANAGAEGRRTLGLNASNSSKGLTLTGDLGYRHFKGGFEGTQLRSRLDPATASFVDSQLKAKGDNITNFANARLGAEYDLDKKNRLSTELSYREGKAQGERIDMFQSSNSGASYDRQSDVDASQRGVSARASWRRSLPGKEHELVADLTVDRMRVRQQLKGITDFAAAPTAFERIRYAIDRNENSAKLDYKRPVGKGASLNLGYQGNFSRSDFDYSGARGSDFDTLLPVASLTNAFEYEQSIHAWFGTYQFGLGKLNTQAGLRLEQVDTTLDQVTDSLRFKNDYFRVYPTLHLGYALSEKSQLRGSYSRRIQRPSPQDLNPYTVYLDPQNLRRGNPRLLPETTDSFELAWQVRKAGTFYSLTGFYRRSRGGVTDIISDLGGGVFVTTRANLATAKRAGVELIANGKLTKTLTYNGSATFLWNEIDTRVGGISDPRSGTSATARATLSWQPTPKDFFQLNPIFSGKQLLPQGYRRSGGMLNLGYRRKVNAKLSLLVTGQDVLSTAKQVTVVRTSTLRDHIRIRGTGRVLLFGLSYNLGAENRRRQEPAFDFQQGGGDTPQ
jgi:outer membrane receptor protein involved in Fe transport